MRHYFEGWYYKQQANGRTLAIIPGKSDSGAFIQAITNKESFCIPYKTSEYKNGDILQVGSSSFSSNGIKLDVKTPGVSLSGELHYSNITPLKSDIMGPFRFLPMECRHGVISMKHDVNGELLLNGEKFSFIDGIGYIESDCGSSFPESYAWIQSNDFSKNCSIMASVAKIPFAGFWFWGIICVVWINGREYRLATYKGAKLRRCSRGVFELQQGNYNLSITVSQRKSHCLDAPKSGMMRRVIKESASCPAEFVFTENDRVIFFGKSRCASYEYNVHRLRHGNQFADS